VKNKRKIREHRKREKMIRKPLRGVDLIE